MSSCTNNKKNCGCASKGITTDYSCVEPPVCQKEPCSEIFATQCIVNTEKISVLINGTSVTIEQNERLDSIIQKLLLCFANPTRANAPKLRILAMSSSSITIGWSGESDGAYTVSRETDGIVSTEIVKNMLQYTFINLSPATEYVIKVKENTSNAESVALTVITLNA